MIAEIAIALGMIMLQPIEEPAQPVVQETVTTEAEYYWDGPVLTAEKGVNDGPSGKETWYNMPMDSFIQFIYDLGFEGYHWIRWDGVHMWNDGTGDYVICGGYLPVRPRGTKVQTSLGPGIVLDTGYFYYGEYQLDIATTWVI